jgi:tRNA(Arg) A34 adenosine deaminase TadA
MMQYAELDDLSLADSRYLSLAARTAAAGEPRNHKLGAVAVRGGRVLGVGANKARNTPSLDIPRSAWSVHAEASCLRQVAYPNGATLYVARVTGVGRTRLARPCPRCWDLAYRLGVTKLIYTTNHGVAVERIIDRPRPHADVYPQYTLTEGPP